MVTQAPPVRRPFRGVAADSALFVFSIGVMAVHVVDDSFVQPEAGTSATDHLVSGLVPLALLALAAVAYPRLRAGARAVVALCLGVFAPTYR